VCPELARELDQPILDMLAKDPAARPATITEAIDALADAAQRAGYPVASAPVRSADRAAGDGKLAERRSGSGTPGDLKRLAEAKSRSEPGGHGTLRGAEADVAPSPGRRMTLIAVAAGALVMGLAAALLLRPDPPPEAGVAPQSAPSAVAAAPLDPPPQQGEAASPAPAQPVAETVSVRIEIDAGPKNAAVFLGAERLGEAPGPFRIPRGTQEIKLRVKAEGYSLQEVPLTPDGDRTLHASLSRPLPVKGTATKTAVQKDLENPF
jgi:serine/threonine-protein kinase